MLAESTYPPDHICHSTTPESLDNITAAEHVSHTHEPTPVSEDDQQKSAITNILDDKTTVANITAVTDGNT